MSGHGSKGEKEMKWIFFDINKDVTEMFTKYLGKQGEVITGSFKDIKCDAIVSPANSFGFMDGGIDYAYSEFFGWDLSERLQAKIKVKWDGELPVGCAELVETNHKDIPYLIAAPTMRVPLNIQNTTNVYLTMKAIVRMANGLDVVSKDIKTIAVPGLGTGVGGVVPERMAWLMLKAMEETPFPSSLSWAAQRHRDLM